MTRREWLSKNPPPKEAGPLRKLIDELAPKGPAATQRISELNAEIAKCARCKAHQTDLVRHINRPQDLFLCPIGPHFFLWTKEGASAKLVPIDLAKSLPGLEEQMDGGWM